MLNTRVLKLEKEMIALINSSGVNVATIALILEKLYREAQSSLEETIKKEEQAMMQQQAQNTGYDIYPEDIPNENN